MGAIADLRAWEIIDSRGTPTVKARITLEDGAIGEFSVPSGASTGIHEAVELRDGDMSRFRGKGVLKAIENINYDIRSILIGVESKSQEEVDNLMLEYDGTSDKSKLGANAILAVSVANAKASAASLNRTLYNYLNTLYEQRSSTKVALSMPTPLFNIMNGGVHADNNISFQEYMVIPKGIPHFAEQLRSGVEIDWQLKDILKKRGATSSVGDEGGVAPSLPSDEVALDLIQEAIQQSGYKEGIDVNIGIDVAISQYWDEDDKVYAIPSIGESGMLVGKADEVIDYYLELINTYPISILEDAFGEDNWEDWILFYSRLKQSNSNLLLVGDDLTTTNPERVQKAIDQKAISGLIVKPNQIGTLSEVFEVVKLCKKNEITVIVSHRSGETTDTFTADLAVALGAQHIKDGAPVRGERVAKYNRLLEIESEIGKQ